MNSERVTLEDARKAMERIREVVVKTPLCECPDITKLCQAERLFFKCENMQLGGAFKLRGASNALLSIPAEELTVGVVTHSSGNHAQALARVAKRLGVPAYIVMPKNSRQSKIDAVKRQQGEITFCESNEKARVETAERIKKATGATFIHPFEDARVIAGQATVALELLSELPSPDVVIVPLGGGGLLSGCLTVLKALSPATKVIGVEPRGAAEAFVSMQHGRPTPLEKPQSIADGLLTTIGALPFSIISKLVDEIVRVDDSEIVSSMQTLWDIGKILVEPSGAVGLAAIASGKVDVTGKTVAIILSGGNIDFPWKLEQDILTVQD